LFLKLTSVPCEAGQLEEALKQYKRAKEYGVERAAMHIRNVSSSNLDHHFQISYITTSIQVSAKILGKTIKIAENTDSTGNTDSSAKKSDS
jgi:hypothetical protein